MTTVSKSSLLLVVTLFAVGCGDPPRRACQDACPSDGAVECTATGPRTCQRLEPDACLEWGAPTACPDGDVCVDGACAGTCEDECSTAATTCSEDASAVVTCADTDADGCLELTSADCDATQGCVDGACEPLCQDTCPEDGAVECAVDGRRTCRTQLTGCLAWDPPTTCEAGLACVGGECVTLCEDECPQAGVTCSDAGSDVVTCADTDEDGCLERTTMTCEGALACVEGTCVSACEDECTQGATQCADGSSTRTCGEYDADDCTEWGAPQACAATEACVDDTCVRQPPPVVVINELLVDAVGADGGEGTTVFVELWGPDSLSLEGFTVAGVNGSKGGDTSSVDLTGTSLDTNGYFVIAHENAHAPLAALAGLLDSGIDFQNGPDSVQLRWHGEVVDAVGYGTFGPEDVFAGEGLPVPAAPAGVSLSRNAAHLDTDDNVADFAPSEPSPGLAAVACVDECDSAGASVCDGTAATLTCGAGYDADACLEWSPSTACTGDEVCSAGQCAPPPCEDECASDGVRRCEADGVAVCGHHDADTCLEWSDATACALGLECSGADAVCVAPRLGNYRWNVHAGAGNSDWPKAVVTTPTGDSVVAGIFTGPMTLGSDELSYDLVDVFLTAISPTGEVLWARDIGGGNNDYVEDLARLPDGDLVFTGSYQGSTTIGGVAMSNGDNKSDVYVARYTADGQPVWGKKFAGDGDNEGLAIATDADGFIYVGGRYEHNFALVGDYGLSGDAFVTKLDGDGVVQWSVGFGGSKLDRVAGVAVDAESNVYVTGVVGTLLDFDPGEGTHQGGPGMFVAKYDSAGRYLWHFVRGGSGYDIAVDAAGDAYVVGSMSGSVNLGGGTLPFEGGGSDGYLFKLSANGAYAWSSHLGSTGPDALRRVAFDVLGNVLVTGDFDGATTWEGVPLAYTEPDAFYAQDVVVARFTPSGELSWVNRFGGSGQDQGRAIAGAANGDVVWAGHFENTVMLNDDSMTSHGYGDLAVVRFTGTADGSPGCMAPGFTCSGHGACEEISGVPTCSCEAGWTGTDCSQCADGYVAQDGQCVSLCAGFTCEGRRHCDASGAAPACVCDAGYEGEQCDTCSTGYALASGCSLGDCECLPDCGPGAAPGTCATCAGALELWPGDGLLQGFFVGDGADAVGGCGGAGPDHAMTFQVDERTRVEMQLSTDSAVIYLRKSCDDPESQVACDAGEGGFAARIAEVLPPGRYTAWLDSQDGNASSYTLKYSFRTDPCGPSTCAGDLVCVSEDWLSTECRCPAGTELSGDDTCLPIVEPLSLSVDVGVTNTCDLQVSPAFLVVPAGQTARITYTNHSADYHVRVDQTPGIDNLSLNKGESWTPDFLWCVDGSVGYTDLSVAEGCGGSHRLHVTCVNETR